jgi:benzil reductase ((S)-benzoin forming)
MQGGALRGGGMETDMKAIVTGHTKGLGAALARNLLARGVPVLGLARTRSDELAQSWPELFEEVELDLADGPALVDWLDGRALTDYLDGTGAVLLLNNAGMVARSGPSRSRTRAPCCAP